MPKKVFSFYWQPQNKRRQERLTTSKAATLSRIWRESWPSGDPSERLLGEGKTRIENFIQKARGQGLIMAACRLWLLKFQGIRLARYHKFGRQD